MLGCDSAVGLRILAPRTGDITQVPLRTRGLFQPRSAGKRPM